MNINYLTNEPIRRVSQLEAERLFEDDEKIFVKLKGDEYLATLKVWDGEFAFKEERFSTMEFYVFADTDTLIVTRHDVIEEFFREKLGVKGRRLNYARPYEVEGKKVYGSLPLSMLALTESTTVVHSSIREDDAVDRMTLEEFVNNIIVVKTYKIDSEEVCWE